MEQSQLDEIKEKISHIKEEIAKRLIGQHRSVDLMVAALLVEGHILIEGMPGLAKTLAARLLAKTLDVDFKRIQFTPDLMPSDILGTSVFNFSNSEFEFRKGPVFSNFILIDEINRSPAKTQSALFELMQERQVTIDGVTYPMDKPFLVIATQNPIEMEGTYRLPEAQMDRFLFKVDFDYPNQEEEVSILQTYNELDSSPSLDSIQTVVTGEELLSYRKLVQSIHIEDKLLRYIASILQRTREHPDLEIGASPRAGVGWMHAAKAWALMQARQYVIPDDIIALTGPVLSHRITLTAEREMEGMAPVKVAQKIAKTVEVPA